MAMAFLLPDNPLSPAGWLPQGLGLLSLWERSATGLCRFDALLRRLRTFTCPSRHLHLIELLANGIDAQTGCFLRVVQDAARAIERAGVQFEELACSQLFLHATVFITIGGMHRRGLPALFDCLAFAATKRSPIAMPAGPCLSFDACEPPANAALIPMQ